MGECPNQREGFRVELFLLDPLHVNPRPVGEVRVLQLAKQSEQGKIVKSHLVRVPFVDILKVLTDSHTMAH